MRDALILGAALAELGGDGCLCLLELRFQAALVALVQLGASGDRVADMDQGGSHRLIMIGESRHGGGERGRLEIDGARVVAGHFRRGGGQVPPGLHHRAVAGFRL